MNKNEYKSKMSEFRLKRRAITSLMKICTEEEFLGLGRQFAILCKEFRLKELISYGFDPYERQNWVINRAMDKLNRTAKEALELASKFR